MRPGAAANAFVLCCGLAAGCARTQKVPGPTPTLRAYVKAVERGDADAAWALLSERERRRTSRADFRRAFAAHRGELQEQAQSLGRLQAHDVPVTGEVPTADGGVVVATLEEGRWYVAGGVAQAELLRTPEQTLHALRRALLRRNYDGVLRVLARAPRAQVEDEVQRLLDALEDPSALHVEQDGDRATIEYAPGYVLHLVFEDGEWRVVEVE